MTWYLWILKYSPPQYAIDLLGKYLWRKKEREMQRQWGNAMMPFLKESKKERAMCIKCIRPQCNSRKVCTGWWGVLEPKYFIEKVLYLPVWVCIHKPLCKVTGLVQHLGSVAWTGLWWWIQKGRAQAISQLCSVELGSWARRFHGHHVHPCTFPSVRVVINLHISQDPSLARQPSSH